MAEWGVGEDVATKYEMPMHDFPRPIATKTMDFDLDEVKVYIEAHPSRRSTTTAVPPGPGSSCRVRRGLGPGERGAGRRPDVWPEASAVPNPLQRGSRTTTLSGGL